MMRYCRGCQTDYPIEVFSPSNLTLDGLSHRCDTCRADHHKNWNRTPSRPRPGYLYIIRASNGLTKIGITHNVSGRLRELTNGSPIPLTLIHSGYSLKANTIEHALHTMFRADHSHAEWFHLSDDQITAAIATVEQEAHNV
jgi:hypothetical protein